MGIPSYFSYIIKNYTNIIRRYEECNQIDALMMDCNSIIYDSYYEILKEGEITNIEWFEEVLIKMVIEKIEQYIIYVKPLKRVYIAFDGLAPIAKLDQQKKRRYKTKFMSQFEPPKIWDTINITVGTDFMNKLSKMI